MIEGPENIESRSRDFPKRGILHERGEGQERIRTKLKLIGHDDYRFPIINLQGIYSDNGEKYLRIGLGPKQTIIRIFDEDAVQKAEESIVAHKEYKAGKMDRGKVSVQKELEMEKSLLEKDFLLDLNWKGKDIAEIILHPAPKDELEGEADQTLVIGTILGKKGAFGMGAMEVKGGEPLYLDMQAGIDLHFVSITNDDNRLQVGRAAFKANYDIGMEINQPDND
ncbi:hypothetical protein A2V71_02630 [Candidatus Berkelbacteria bacterium RBG_13_40_8]|uniref:Uncharacterized protein n=1 Tax=Candidatus Berkelbacteria bacterium RBG_13_40_8 TaxID=1797467 RepID=A0A1F5DPA1_9BACT|nr:MAG: hypothetical protein A2V71_02630 [Candidatus Berkelbacteria bacterium RBG_13_40_8]